MHITTVTQKGQVTIPIDIRRHLGLKPGDSVQFFKTNGEFRVKPIPNFFSFRGSLKGKKVPSEKTIDKISQQFAVERYLRSLKYSQ